MSQPNFYLPVNNVKTTVVGNYTAGSRLLNVLDGSKIAVTDSRPCRVTVIRQSDSAFVIYKVSAVANEGGYYRLTVDPIESTTDLNFVNNDRVEMRITAGALEDIHTAVDDLYTTISGNFGPQGIQGIQGVAGPTGPTGQTGPQGVIGNQGSQGVLGSQGVQGFQGYQGYQGLTGNPSNVQGPQGARGFQGLTGFTGPQGLMGQTGAQGGTGFQGTAGTPGGPQGVSGVQGIQGFQGDPGLPGGPQGIQGIQGTTGFVGPIGPTGPIGLQGVQGLQGSQGNTGFQGYQGPQGFQGVQGVQGNQGFQGFQGFLGTQGFQGVQGRQGFQGVQGVQGVQGNFGYQGIVGATGPQGVQGGFGLQGRQGTQGTPATATVSIGSPVSGGSAFSIPYIDAGILLNQSPGGLTFNPSTNTLSLFQINLLCHLGQVSLGYGNYNGAQGAITGGPFINVHTHEGPQTVTLPLPEFLPDGTIYIIKDADGYAQTHPISIVSNGYINGESVLTNGQFEFSGDTGGSTGELGIGLNYGCLRLYSGGVWYLW